MTKHISSLPTVALNAHTSLRTEMLNRPLGNRPPRRATLVEPWHTPGQNPNPTVRESAQVVEMRLRTMQTHPGAISVADERPVHRPSGSAHGRCAAGGGLPELSLARALMVIGVCALAGLLAGVVAFIL